MGRDQRIAARRLIKRGLLRNSTRRSHQPPGFDTSNPRIISIEQPKASLTAAGLPVRHVGPLLARWNAYKN